MKIDPMLSVSEPQIRQSLLDFVQGQPDGARWLDFFAGGHGSTLTEMMSALGAYMRYNANAARRESNILTAKLRSTIYAACYSLGYPPNRRTSARLKITISNPGPALFWDKYSPIGYISGSPISLEDGNVRSGVHEYYALVGEWRTHTTTVSTTQEFWEWHIPTPVETQYVCNSNVEVFRNGTSIPVTHYLENMEDGAVLVKNLINTLTVTFGADYFGFGAEVGDEIRVDYLEIKHMEGSGDSFIFDACSLTLPEPLMVLNVEVQRRENPEDSLYKLTQMAPGYHQSKRSMITPYDHEALVGSAPGILSARYAPGICSVNYLDAATAEQCLSDCGTWTDATDGCCTNYMSYLRHDETALLPTEEDALYEYIKDFQVAGSHVLFRRAEPILVNPKYVVLIEQGADTDYIRDMLNLHIEQQCYKIGGSFRPGLITSQLTRIEGVKYPYLIKPLNDRRLSWLAYFKPGDVEVIFTQNEDELNRYGGECGGYTDPEGYQLVDCESCLPNEPGEPDCSPTGLYPPVLVQDFGTADLNMGGRLCLTLTGSINETHEIDFTGRANLIYQLEQITGVQSASYGTGSTSNVLTIMGSQRGPGERLMITCLEILDSNGNPVDVDIADPAEGGVSNPVVPGTGTDDPANPYNPDPSKVAKFTSFSVSPALVQVGNSVAYTAQATWNIENRHLLVDNSIQIRYQSVAGPALTDSMPLNGPISFTMPARATSSPETVEVVIMATLRAGGTINRSFTIMSNWRVFFGNNFHAVLTAAQGQALQGSRILETAELGELELGAGGYKWVCYPVAMGQRTVFRDAFGPVPMNDPTIVQILPGIDYYCHRTFNIMGGSLQLRVE